MAGVKRLAWNHADEGKAARQSRQPLPAEISLIQPPEPCGLSDLIHCASRAHDGMQTTSLLRLWGKSDREDPSHYHPLLFHMLDVAHVARALWDGCLSPLARGHIAEGLSLPEAEADNLVVLLAGLHDLGKASPVFQKQVPVLAKRLSEIGLRIGPHTQSPARRPHGRISAREVERTLSRAGIPLSLARVLARVTGGHHGIFPGDYGRFSDDTLGDRLWRSARDHLVRVSANSLLGEGAPIPIPRNPSALPASGIPVLAGLISVADWIGSSDHFPFEPDMTLAGYLPLSCTRARDALIALGWLPALEPASRCDFGTMFPFLPNPLQRATVDISDQTRPPYLLLIEAPMGEGKTEAALYAADSCLSAGAAGFYVALPTQATSSAMYRRVRQDYLETRGHSGVLNLQLVHGNAVLAREYKDLSLGPVYDESASGQERSEVSAQAWFTARKRPLLAPFGVGTIDQSLLSVLQTKHWFVRLFGLANKTIIFDEVHAYDTYMSALLERLLQWLSAVNCTVVLLSATLPSSRRQALIQAYRTGAQGPAATSYPRVTHVAGDQVCSLPVATTEISRREVTLRFAGNEFDSLSHMLREALADGGCAAVICNTVGRAQGVYGILRDSLRDCECYLFHARAPFRWRREREQQVLAMFGKHGERPTRAVLVATQVIEQSLDLDFDWMASEMAPADLLLQRIGRMHRHARTRPSGLESPCFTILCDSGPPHAPPSFGPSEAVYERYVLLRSWLALRRRTSLRLPDDIEELVEEAYAADDPPDLDPDWSEALAEARAAAERRRREDERVARGVLIPPPGDAEELLDQFSLRLSEDDDPTIHPTLRAATRLGPPSISCVCLFEAPDGELLPATGGQEVLLGEKPDAVRTRDLLDASLSLSHKRLYHLLCDSEVPSGWRSSPQLRFHRILRFREGRCELGPYILSLNRELGLTLDKEDVQ